MNNTIEKRITSLRRSIYEKEIDTLLVLVEENRRYLSGFTGEDTQFNESAGVLIITDSKLILATDSRFKTQAENETDFFDIICYKEGLSKKLPDILRSTKTKKLGFESTRMSYMDYEKVAGQLKLNNIEIELVPAENIVEDLRLIKDETEINEIKKALFMAESVFAKFKSEITTDMTEKNAAWIMEKGMREAGADSISFPTICASGKNSALPHAIPTDKKFKKGEPVLFDWGARINGYCSDISRTIVTGKPDSTFQKVYKTVLEAQAMAIEAIKPGISGKEIDRIARSHIEGMGFKGKFGHGLGHGVGLAVHELPRLSPIQNQILKEKMVFTVEPGIYLPEWGGVRLENMVVVRKHGAEVLNKIEPNC